MAEPDAGIDADVAEVVGGERNFVADVLADGGDEIGHSLDAFRGQFDAGEHVLHGRVAGNRNARGRGDRARDILHQVDAEVHFEPRKPCSLRFFRRWP